MGGVPWGLSKRVAYGGGPYHVSGHQRTDGHTGKSNGWMDIPGWGWGGHEHRRPWPCMTDHRC
eukprot:365566-Chlamydomonas_euryale.AAC.15